MEQAASGPVGATPDPRLAAVRRVLDWAARSPADAARSPHLGAACARLLPPSTLEDPAGLVALRFALDAWAEEGASVLDAAIAAAEALCPLAEAAPRLDAPARGQLFIPGEAPRPAASAEAPAATAADASSSPEAPPAGSGEPRPPRERTREPRDREPRDRDREPRDRDREPRERDRERRPPRGEARPPAVEEPPKPPPPPPPPPRRPLGDPDGSGAPIESTLALTDTEREALADAGVETIADLLLLPPRDHLRIAHMPVSAALSAGTCTVRGRVRSRSVRLAPGIRRVEVVLEGATDGRLVCRWVGAPPRGHDTWERGAEIALVGDVLDVDGELLLFEAEPVGLDGRGSGLLPVYGVDGLDDRRLRDLVSEALRAVDGTLEDPLPAALLERYRLLPLEDALRDAHFPGNTSGRGRVRLAFDELLTLQLGVVWRSGRSPSERGLAHRLSHTSVGQIDVQHNIRLTDAQETAFSDIRRDLARPQPMARLLQGDVNAGKGLIVLLTAAVVAEAGAQVAIVAPDPLAAERRYLHAEAVLRSIGIACLLANGERITHAQADAIRRGEAQVVFGTGALLAADTPWKKLGLVVVEERGTLGSVGPSSLPAPRGQRPDLLVYTRAPIPSSLAFTVFGDLELSIVPADTRARVTSTVVPAGHRAEAYARAREAVEAGRQVFVVFPVKDGRDLLGVEDARRFAEALSAELLPGARIGLYCTGMGREERSRAFDDFHHRRIDVLVATTFIEEAPPVANAAMMLVEYADLHDIVRLHRLRAHVGLGHWPGACTYILSDDPSPEARAAVELVSSEKDGFRIAELDLARRGAEAVLGDRAAEMPEFRWADPPKDRELLLRARAEAFQMVRDDPGLRRAGGLAQAVSLRWGDWLGAAPGEGRRSASDKDDRKRRRRRRRKRA